MIVRVAVLTLVLLLVLSVVARWRALRAPARRGGPVVQAAHKCPGCGAYVFGSQPDPCDRDDCRYRRPGARQDAGA
jgi:hypothetical protein